MCGRVARFSAVVCMYVCSNMLAIYRHVLYYIYCLASRSKCTESKSCAVLAGQDLRDGAKPGHTEPEMHLWRLVWSHWSPLCRMAGRQAGTGRDGKPFSFISFCWADIIMAERFESHLVPKGKKGKEGKGRDDIGEGQRDQIRAISPLQRGTTSAAIQSH